MAERKCIDPRNVEQSGGRVTCPDRFFKVFFDKPNCGKCPKASESARLYLGQTSSPVERIANASYMRNLLNDLK